jgi:ATP/maltotriose-dependent transcriptional regulator MalT
LPAEIHVFILGRGLPPAPLWRLRSKQRLCVINESMLAFTQFEAEGLFASYGLDAQRANASLTKTGGRAAAIHAAAKRGAAAMRTEEDCLRDFA